MSRRRRTAIGGAFAPRRIDLLNSPAYRALSLSGHRLLSRVEIELANHGGADNGRLPITYQDFVDYGIHKQAIYPAIQEAVALGLLEVTQQGVAGGPEYRKPNLFRLTYRADDRGRGDGTHEWMKIGEDEALLIAAAARALKAPKKQNQRYGKRPFSVRKPYRKQPSNSTETTTTGNSTETTTTIYISGREDAA